MRAAADVLIVDDTEDELTLLETVFKLVEPRLSIETEGQSGNVLRRLKQEKEKRPRVVLLDLRMPGKTGQELLAEIRADKDLRVLPVCVFSNSDLQADVCSCYELGANFYFKKPSGLEATKDFVKSFSTLWFQNAILCH